MFQKFLELKESHAMTHHDPLNTEHVQFLIDLGSGLHNSDTEKAFKYLEQAQNIIEKVAEDPTKEHIRLDLYYNLALVDQNESKRREYLTKSLDIYTKRLNFSSEVCSDDLSIEALSRKLQHLHELYHFGFHSEIERIFFYIGSDLFLENKSHCIEYLETGHRNSWTSIKLRREIFLVEIYQGLGMIEKVHH